MLEDGFAQGGVALVSRSGKLEVGPSLRAGRLGMHRFTPSASVGALEVSSAKRKRECPFQPSSPSPAGVQEEDPFWRAPLENSSHERDERSPPFFRRGKRKHRRLDPSAAILARHLYGEDTSDVLLFPEGIQFLPGEDRTPSETATPPITTSRPRGTTPGVLEKGRLCDVNPQEASDDVLEEASSEVQHYDKGSASFGGPLSTEGACATGDGRERGGTSQMAGLADSALAEARRAKSCD